jgi:vitamin B12 transporter
LDRATIESVPSDDVGAILGRLGLTAREYPSTLTNLIVRGFRTEAHGNDLMGGVLVLLNGRRYGSSNLGKIFTANVDRIEVIRGPAAVQYGSAAMGGVINVITREGSGPLTGFVEAGLGSFGIKKSKLALSGSVKDFDYSFGYVFSTRDDYQSGDGKTYEETRYKSKQNLNADLGYSFGDGLHRVGVNFNYFLADDAWSPSYIYNQGLGQGRLQDKYNESLDLTYRGATKDNHFSWMARYAMGRDVDKNGMNPKAPNPADRGPSSHNIIDSDLIQALFTHERSFYRFTLGLDYIHYDRTSLSSPKISSYEDAAGYLLGKLRFLDDSLIVSLGLRHDTYKVTLEDVRSEGNATKRHLSPSLGVAYSPVEWLKLRVNWAKAFLMPDARQLAGDYDSSGIHVIGNPNLKPELSDTWELGFDAANPYMSASFTYFESRSTNKITSGPTVNGERTYINLDKAERKGVELEATMDLGALLDYDFQLAPYFNLTHMFTYKDKKTNLNLEYVPKWVVSYGVNFNYPRIGLSATVNTSYTGEQNIVVYPPPNNSPSFPGILGGVSITDISVKKTIMDFGTYGDLDLKVEVSNVFDKYYESVRYYPNPGRSFYMAVAYNF